jgi:hypothetical protein
MGAGIYANQLTDGNILTPLPVVNNSTKFFVDNHANGAAENVSPETDKGSSVVAGRGTAGGRGRWSLLFRCAPTSD